MRAITYDHYGPPDSLQLREVEKPVPGDGEVLVRIRAAAVNPYDWHFMRGEPYFMRLMTGLRAPKRHRLGVDFAGEVEAAGQGVKRLRPGDQVYGMKDGAFAEYLTVSESKTALKPANLTFEEAAAVPLGALTALQGLRDAGNLQPGQRVLIIGASGGVGTFAVQIAKVIGAHVTGVCSTEKVEMVRALGADEVVDYTREDFAKQGTTYDLIFQLGGMDSPAHCRRALTPEGKLLLSSGDSNGRWLGPLNRIIQATLLSPLVSQSLVSLTAVRSREDLDYIRELIEAGQVKPVIECTYPLHEVPAAIAHVEKGHTRGKVVITIG